MKLNKLIFFAEILIIALVMASCGEDPQSVSNTNTIKPKHSETITQGNEEEVLSQQEEQEETLTQQEEQGSLSQNEELEEEVVADEKLETTSVQNSLLKELDGTTWETGCVSTQLESTGVSANFNFVKVSVQFSGSEEIITGHAYATRFCIIKLVTIEGVSKLQVGNSRILEDGNEVIEVEHIVQTATATVFNFISTSFMNSFNVCGSNDWKSNVPKSLLGVDCVSDLEQFNAPGFDEIKDLGIFNVDDVLYDIIHIDRNQLTIGDHLGENRGFTEETRPDTLWNMISLTKK